MSRVLDGLHVQITMLENAVVTGAGGALQGSVGLQEEVGDVVLSLGARDDLFDEEARFYVAIALTIPDLWVSHLQSGLVGTLIGLLLGCGVKASVVALSHDDKGKIQTVRFLLVAFESLLEDFLICALDLRDLVTPADLKLVLADAIAEKEYARRQTSSDFVVAEQPTGDHVTQLSNHHLLARLQTRGSGKQAEFAVFAGNDCGNRRGGGHGAAGMADVCTKDNRVPADAIESRHVTPRLGHLMILTFELHVEVESEVRQKLCGRRPSLELAVGHAHAVDR